MFTIRRATQEDREGIWRAHFGAVSETCATHYSPDVIRIWAGGLRPEKYEAAIRSSEFFVAEEGGAVVGFAELDRETGEVQGLYVSPEVAGRGVGRALLGKLEEIARARGLGSMHLTSSLNAVTFYERAGFVPTGTETRTLGPGVERASVKMLKKLGGEGGR